jgi:asparagine synthase (glutamine-hydrolysing)
MCGIIGYHHKNGISRENLKKVLDSLNYIRHRGIDGEGLMLIDTQTGKHRLLKTKDTPSDVATDLAYEDYEDLSADLVLAHRRLSIIDLSSNGFQPMKDENNNAIIFNGEIYNYIEIKQELETLGYTFKTTSDTEVILAAYRHYGEACFSKFNGMWSIIIWDNTNRKLVVSNDRFGVKQLYHYRNEEELMFSSEVKAFYPFKKAIAKLNHKAIEEFLENGILDAGKDTFFEEIHIFPKAHFQITTLSDYTGRMQKYWKGKTEVNHSYTEKSAVEEFNYLITDAIKLRLRADVECGVALSGGLDSSLICYYAHNILSQKDIGHHLKSFSVIFPGEKEDESYFSKYIVNDLKLDGKFIDPSNNFKFDDLEKLIYHLDYPLQSTSFYSSWNMMRLVSQNGLKVLIEGQGADELFAGYHHHFYKYGRELILKGKISRYFSEVNTFAAYKNRPTSEIHKIIVNDVKLLAKIKTGIVKQQVNKEYAKLIHVLENDFNSIMLPAMLRADDRSSMAFGVETRLPFMDYRIVEFASRLPDHFKINKGWQKYIVRKSAEIVPDEIRYRKDKKGFTTPQKTWMQTYKQEFENYTETLKSIGLNAEELKRGAANDPDKLFRIYSLAIWLQVTKAHL